MFTCWHAQGDCPQKNTLTEICLRIKFGTSSVPGKDWNLQVYPIHTLSGEKMKKTKGTDLRSASIKHRRYGQIRFSTRKEGNILITRRELGLYSVQTKNVHVCWELRKAACSPTLRTLDASPPSILIRNIDNIGSEWEKQDISDNLRNLLFLQTTSQIR
jgi:hypothetical protein